MPSNELYFVVLPLIHLGPPSFGLTEQVLTLVPDRNFATEFFPEEVSGYIATFENRAKYFVGGHVVGFSIEQLPTPNGRVIVRVVQNVK
jgi:hypothetical protein